MTTRAWFFAVVVAGAVGCSSRTTGGESNEPKQGAGNGGTSSGNPLGGGAAGDGKVASGGVAGGGGLPGGGSAGAVNLPRGGSAGSGGLPGVAGGPAGHGCFEIFMTCTAFVMFPIVSLPDGTLITCADSYCVEQAIAGGQIASSPGSGHAELVDNKLRASWSAQDVGSFVPTSCVGAIGNSVSFKSPSGAVVPLFSGKVPVSVSYQSCAYEAQGAVVLQEPVDIAALVQAAEEGGAGGAGGGAGAGNEPGGGAGGAP